MELVDDAYAPFGTLVEAAIAKRHARGIGAYLITGSGVGQPLGLTTAVTSFVTSAASTLTLADFEAVYAALDPIYRANAVWYMSDSTRALVTKLLEVTGRPMIGPVNELLRRPIAVCNSMNAVVPSALDVAVLANRDYILQRHVPKSTYVRRYTQRYVEQGFVGFQGFTRVDQQPILFDSAFPPAVALNVHS